MVEDVKLNRLESVGKKEGEILFSGLPNDDCNVHCGFEAPSSPNNSLIFHLM